MWILGLKGLRVPQIKRFQSFILESCETIVPCQNPAQEI